ncbi:MAG: hypothetical protein U9Q06_04430 [Nanoarchaeota archaeon]|nr:hypothetical protein [Nanoarchaeota archaeon]
MGNIQLEGGRTIEPHDGRNVDKAPALLARQEKGEGYIPSEADIRLLGVKNFGNASQIANDYWDTSTLSATKGKDVKVILPYETGSRKLTEPARFGLALINPDEELVNYGVNLDVDGRWEKLNGNGVYTLQREGLILNKDLREEQAMKHRLLLIKLGHPDHVDKEFWMYKGEKNKSIDGVQALIHDTFKLGESKHGYDIMMGQYLPDVSDKGVLKAWCVNWLGGRAGSIAWTRLDDDLGRFAFNSVGDAKLDAEGVDVDKARAQLQSLEGMLQTGKIDQIGSALDERDQLRQKLLTTDQIYSVIGDYIGSANEGDVRKAIDELTKQ